MQLRLIVLYKCTSPIPHWMGLEGRTNSETIPAGYRNGVTGNEGGSSADFSRNRRSNDFQLLLTESMHDVRVSQESIEAD